MVFGIDIGTTSVAGVAVGSDGQVLASTTLAHHADLPTNGNGVDEQDPAKLLAAVESVKADLLTKLSLGDCPRGMAAGRCGRFNAGRQSGGRLRGATAGAGVCCRQSRDEWSVESCR